METKRIYALEINAETLQKVTTARMTSQRGASLPEGRAWTAGEALGGMRLTISSARHRLGLIEE